VKSCFSSATRSRRFSMTSQPRVLVTGSHTWLHCPGQEPRAQGRR
jgi:hypothetical protein